ncbi:MAG: hypothetical protein ACPGVH_06515 [Chitinophagales bacterium]
MEIKLLKREEIDDKVWNGCVHFAVNAMPYAYTWYLDNVTEEWEGLVMGNYKAVMPLVFEKKFGVEYLYQPFFTQQLGVFTSLPLTKNLVNNFIAAIPKKYKYIDINLNEINDISESEEISKRSNYFLDLNLDYALLKSNYSKNTIRNLNKAENSELLIQYNIKPETFVDFYIKNTADKIDNFKDKHKHMMLRIIYKALSFQLGSIISVTDKNGEILAANFILFHPTRIINLLPTSNNEGKSKNAMVFLIDYLLQKNANQKKIFDFEGSMIEGIARFYKGFGAEETNYYRLKRNKLPWFYRIIKK